MRCDDTSLFAQGRSNIGRDYIHRMLLIVLFDIISSAQYIIRFMVFPLKRRIVKRFQVYYCWISYLYTSCVLYWFVRICVSPRTTRQMYRYKQMYNGFILYIQLREKGVCIFLRFFYTTNRRKLPIIVYHIFIHYMCVAYVYTYKSLFIRFFCIATLFVLLLFLLLYTPTFTLLPRINLLRHKYIFIILAIYNILLNVW